MARVVHQEESPSFLTPKLRRTLVALLLGTCGILFLLSFLGLASTAGDYIDTGLGLTFGTLRFFLPVVLFALAYVTDRVDEATEGFVPHIHTAHIVGSLLLLISLSGLAHTFHAQTALESAQEGIGGGYVGFGVNSVITPYFGVWAARVLFFAFLLAGLVLFFNVTMTVIIKALQARGLLLHGKIAGMMHATATDNGGNEVTFIRRLIKRNQAPKIIMPEAHEEDDEEEEIEEEEEVEEVEEVEPTRNEPIKPTEPKRIYALPSIKLLKKSVGVAQAGDITNNIKIIEKTFSTFHIPVEMGETRVGPTVTQYTMRPAEGVKVARITGLTNDLALALAAHPIRIEAPIPGKSLIGIEVPNQKSAMVTLHDLLTDEEFEKIKGNYHIALGKDVSGKGIFAHLPSMPHLLVAGSTGSGKTVCVNTIILSLLFQHTPDELRFIMVDPKRVELPLYNGIPHLLTPVITETSKTINALKWAIGEMERRFDTLMKAKCRDIASYNKQMGEVGGEKLPVIVFIVDELADLMVTSGAEVEGGIIRLAQMARAVGIHLILATQRPSVDVITGLIKANVPGRIAFSVASLVDSRTIIDMSGAEKLLGKGDMLFSNASLPKPKRIQGAYVSEDEMKKVIDFFKTDDAPSYDDTITDRAKQSSMFGESAAESDDPLYNEAKQIVVSAGKASTSYLQRRLKVGYSRAARLIDMLEEHGVIGPGDGAKPREVLLKGGGMVTQPQPPQAEKIVSMEMDEEFVDDSDEVIEENFDDLR